MKVMVEKKLKLAIYDEFEIKISFKMTFSLHLVNKNMSQFVPRGFGRFLPLPLYLTIICLYQTHSNSLMNNNNSKLNEYGL
jgi:hypothetical protein